MLQVVKLLSASTQDRWSRSCGLLTWRRSWTPPTKTRIGSSPYSAARRAKKPFRFRLEADQWWEIVLNIKPVNGRLGSGSAWSGGGNGGREEIKVHGVNFSFRNTIRDKWRSDYTEGQFPVLYFWRL